MYETKVFLCDREKKTNIFKIISNVYNICAIYSNVIFYVTKLHAWSNALILCNIDICDVLHHDPFFLILLSMLILTLTLVTQTVVKLK